jgi:hypothetical protein
LDDDGVLKFTVVVHLDEVGRVREAYIEELRSPTLDACIRKEVEAWELWPARDCDGLPMAGTYREHVVDQGRFIAR